MSIDQPDFEDDLGLGEEPEEELFVQDGPDLFGDALASAEPAAVVDPDFDVNQLVPEQITDPDEFAGGIEPSVVPEESTEISSAEQSASDGIPASGPAAEQDAPLALYRRYRPDDFRDLIGQEQVTEPLMRAIANGKVNHAYLFSGPRGCGKTTSARILARCLNCEQGPTPHPCGQCQSCRDLATGGPGSIDVIEIDAASHGLVEDARDLRERAYFAPVASRYKVYIIDEAHMVTTHGFNALLKVVEEPPAHVKFIFATTEPDKVIGTVRSRTHHYPFRLVPPRIMTSYLEKICAEEGVDVERGVLPLVVRAGGGSVRDSLSVLDQLLGAAGQRGVSYAQAAGLLGFTPDALLDEMVDAFAAGDGRGVFATIDRVIEVGQDPRRFGEDLLQRMRDLVIVASVPDAISSGLIDVANDQAERLTAQASALGAGELTRAAEVIAEGLTQMRGTTAPRLHLELICARVLLPGADVDDRGVHARLDRLERRLGFAGSAAPAAPAKWEDVPDPESSAPTTAAQPAASEPGSRPQRQQRPASTSPAVASNEPGTKAGQPAAAASTSAGALNATELRRLWPQVLEEVKSRKRFTHALLNQNAQVADVSNGQLLLSFSSQGVLDRFNEGGSADVLSDSLIEVVGAELRIVTQVDGGELDTSKQASAAPTAAGNQPHAAARPDPAPVRRQRPAGTPPSAAKADQPQVADRDGSAQVDDDASLDDEIIDDPTKVAAQLLVEKLDAELIEDE